MSHDSSPRSFSKDESTTPSVKGNCIQSVDSRWDCSTLLAELGRNNSDSQQSYFQLSNFLPSHIASTLCGEVVCRKDILPTDEDCRIGVVYVPRVREFVFENCYAYTKAIFLHQGGVVSYKVEKN